MTIPASHSTIYEKLQFYISSGKIPNIVFHGEPFNGKKTLLKYFVNTIYKKDAEVIKKYCMYVNCAHGKGIKFIREDVKFFAKTYMHCDENHPFKTIAFYNADNLTIEAQSALRRCIELFSHNTRFFIVVVDRYKLLKPILSRFCEVYVPPITHLEMKNMMTPTLTDLSQREARRKYLVASLDKYLLCDCLQTGFSFKHIQVMAHSLYQQAYAVVDVVLWLRNLESTHMQLGKKYKLLFLFEKLQREVRSEPLLFVMLLHFIALDTSQLAHSSLDNISFM